MTGVTDEGMSKRSGDGGGVDESGLMVVGGPTTFSLLQESRSELVGEKLFFLNELQTSKRKDQKGNGETEEEQSGTSFSVTTDLITSRYHEFLDPNPLSRPKYTPKVKSLKVKEVDFTVVYSEKHFGIIMVQLP